MSRAKKGFGGSTSTISAAESAVKTVTTSSKAEFLGGITVTLVDIKSIEPDPDNPRNLSVKQLIQQGLKYNSQDYESEKNKIKDNLSINELEKLEQLALSIKTNGLLNALVVRKNANKFTIIAGERRFLACTLLGLDAIPVKILSREMGELEIKLLQWAENCDREDLTTWDRLNNVRQISNAYKEQNKSLPSARKLSELMSIQKSQAARYLSLIKEDLNSPLMSAVHRSKISSLKTIEFISQIQDIKTKEKIISLAANGSSLRKLQEIVSENPGSNIRPTKSSACLSFKIPSNPNVSKLILISALQAAPLKQYSDTFSNINWEKQSDLKKAWAKLFKHAELEVSE